MDSSDHQTEKQTIYWEGYYEGKKESKAEIKRLREVIVNEINRLKYFVDSESIKAQQVLLKALKER